MYTVSWEYAQFSSAWDFMLSGHPGHEPLSYLRSRGVSESERSDYFTPSLHWGHSIDLIIMKQHTAHCKLRHSTTTIRYPICWQSNDQAEQKHSPRKSANKNGSSKADQNIHLYKSCDLNLGSSKNRKSLWACWSYKRCFCTIPIEFKLNLDIEQILASNPSLNVFSCFTVPLNSVSPQCYDTCLYIHTLTTR